MDLVNVREAFEPVIFGHTDLKGLIFGIIVVTLWFLLYEELKK